MKNKISEHVLANFHTHTEFQQYQVGTLRGLMQRVEQWLSQRNTYDADHSGTKYFEKRLKEVIGALTHAELYKHHIVIQGVAHNFDEEGEMYSLPTFRGSLNVVNEWNIPDSQIDGEVSHVDDQRGGRYKHYYYHLYHATQGQDPTNAPLDTLVLNNQDEDDLRENMEEAIPNADVESIIGNLLLMLYLKDINVRTLAASILDRLQIDRKNKLCDQIRVQGVFHTVTSPSLECMVDIQGLGIATLVSLPAVMGDIHARVVSTNSTGKETLVYISG